MGLGATRAGSDRAIFAGCSAIWHGVCELPSDGVRRESLAFNEVLSAGSRGCPSKERTMVAATEISAVTQAFGNSGSERLQQPIPQPAAAAKPTSDGATSG